MKKIKLLLVIWLGVSISIFAQNSNKSTDTNSEKVIKSDVVEKKTDVTNIPKTNDNVQPAPTESKNIETFKLLKPDELNQLTDEQKKKYLMDRAQWQKMKREELLKKGRPIRNTNTQQQMKYKRPLRSNQNQLSCIIVPKGKEIEGIKIYIDFKLDNKPSSGGFFSSDKSANNDSVLACKLN
jgi:bisphosphoglycerate-independent phosphoglycerate mutase (AlkP superfamily)